MNSTDAKPQPTPEGSTPTATPANDQTSTVVCIDTSKGLTLGVQNLYYTVTERKTQQKKVILNNINMVAEPGVLLAIMGPSGSGKTSLLNAIAGRIRIPRRSKTTTLTGNLYCDGPVDFKEIKSYSKYVMQHDHLLEFLTVRETLNFAADLRLHYVPKSERRAKVNQLVRELGLEDCMDVLVGGGEMQKGISGGQKKRVCIAIELLDNPKMLFLDEPTTGLDSSRAYDVAYNLVRLAREGRTVVCTIHQPRSQVFSLFDKVMLLNEGRCVYQGETNRAVPYFASIGHRCPSTFNPADYLLDILSPNNVFNHKEGTELRGETELKSLLHKNTSSMMLMEEGEIGSPINAIDSSDPDLKPPYAKINTSEPRKLSEQRSSLLGRIFLTPKEVTELPEHFLKSSFAQDLDRKLEKMFSRTYSKEVSPNEGRMRLRYCGVAKSSDSDRRTFGSWFANFLTLIQRNFLNSVRNPLQSYVGVAVNILFALLLGGVFFQLDQGGSTQAETLLCVTNVLGLMFFLVCQFMFANFDTLLSVPKERVTFNRDTMNGLYPASAFYAAKNVADFPYQHLRGTVFLIVAYFMSGLGGTATQFFQTFLFVHITIFSACGYFYCIGSLVPRVELANIIAPVGTILFIMVGGFYLKDDYIPKWIAWLRHINMLRYAFFTFVQAQYPPGGSVGTGAGEVTNEDVVHQIAGIPNISMWLSALYNFLLGAAFRILGFVALYYCNRSIGVDS